MEAEIEVKEFIDKFGFSINDPQNEGMAEGPCTKEGFIRGWNYGNEIRYRSILNSDDPPEVIHIVRQMNYIRYGNGIIKDQ